jgi:hypothetical protein
MESSKENVVEICTSVMKIQTQNTSEGCSTRAAFVILEGRECQHKLMRRGLKVL